MADIEKTVYENVRSIGSEANPNEGGTAAHVGRPDLEPSLVCQCVDVCKIDECLTNGHRRGTRTIPLMQTTIPHRWSPRQFPSVYKAELMVPSDTTSVASSLVKGHIENGRR